MTRNGPGSNEPKQIGPLKWLNCLIPDTLVIDNLNTHTKGAFYTVFEPAITRAYVKRLDFVYTPNMAVGSISLSAN